MFQSVVIAGNLGGDPEMRYTANGKAVTQFSVAVNGRKDDPPEWFTVVCWERVAELAAEHLHKGSKVLCAGRMQTRSWEGQDGQKRYKTELVAERVQFLDPKAVTSGGSSRDNEGDLDPDQLPFHHRPENDGWQDEERVS